MKKRQFVKGGIATWVTPSIITATIPAHAQTTGVCAVTEADLGTCLPYAEGCGTFSVGDLYYDDGTSADDVCVSLTIVSESYSTVSFGLSFRDTGFVHGVAEGGVDCDGYFATRYNRNDFRYAFTGTVKDGSLEGAYHMHLTVEAVNTVNGQSESKTGFISLGVACV